jgi:hypothetical protein
MRKMKRCYGQVLRCQGKEVLMMGMGEDSQILADNKRVESPLMQDLQGDKWAF